MQEDRHPAIRLLVAIEVDFYRVGVAGLLNGTAAVDVVGLASTPAEALALVDELCPDVVLLDVRLDEGLRVASEIGGRHPTTRVLPVMVPERDDTVWAWATAGAAGYVTARTTPDELVDSIRRVARGEGVCTGRGVAALLRGASDHAGRRHSVATAGGLTDRELEVLDLLDEGLTNKEIGERLHLSVPTVKHHVSSILAKLKVRRRVEAGQWARQSRVRIGAEN